MKNLLTLTFFLLFANLCVAKNAFTVAPSEIISDTIKPNTDAKKMKQATKKVRDKKEEKSSKTPFPYYGILYYMLILFEIAGLFGIVAAFLISPIWILLTVAVIVVFFMLINGCLKSLFKS